MLLPAEIFQVIILVFPLILLQCIMKHAPWTDASVVPTAPLNSDIHAITTASTIAFPLCCLTHRCLATAQKRQEFATSRLPFYFRLTTSHKTVNRQHDSLRSVKKKKRKKHHAPATLAVTCSWGYKCFQKSPVNVLSVRVSTEGVWHLSHSCLRGCGTQQCSQEMMR